MPVSLRERYADLIASGAIERDPAQDMMVARMARLEERLGRHRLARKSSSLGWLFGSRNHDAPIKGLYIHGEVGRGKTMLMDLFFAASPVTRKRRAHFHEFMADVHERIHAYRQKLKRGEVKGDDPIAPVAAELAEEAWLLCFDEFHVTDIADAMILGRLFQALFGHGVVVVATSNVAPQDLYKDGLNRALFLPFIAMIEQHMEVVRLEARTDFRMEKLAGVLMWYVPADDKTSDYALEEAWGRLTGNHPGAAVTLTVKGRKLVVPKAARGVAWFSFADLCEQPLGASDYAAIAHEFHSVILERIPRLDPAQRNAAKRFITLIDTFYDNAVKLIASADAAPEELYEGDGTEAFEFKRTVSRLTEMRSRSYLALPHGRRDSQASGSTEGLVET
jgi:cell division protein ZapE